MINSLFLQLNIHVIFEGEKEFEQKISLWGVSAASLSHTFQDTTM